MADRTTISARFLRLRFWVALSFLLFTTTQVLAVNSDQGPCAGRVTSFELLPGQDNKVFWAPFLLHDPSEKSIAMAEMLRLYLVDEQRNQYREWTLSQLDRFSWFVDFTDYEDLFRECDARYEFQCSRFFVMNKLVFGDRHWKRGFLSRALKTETDPYGDPVAPVVYDGFSVELSSKEAVRLVVYHGMMELEAEMGSALKRIASANNGHKENLETQHVDVAFEYVGTESGNLHPAIVLADRITALEPAQIALLVLEEDVGFQMVISRYQSLLRTTIPFIEFSDGVREVTFEDDEVLPRLMEPLGKAYRWFVENPPEDLIESEDDYFELKSKLWFVLSGGCHGAQLEDWAFDSPGEMIRSESKGKQRLRERSP